METTSTRIYPAERAPGLTTWLGLGTMILVGAGLYLCVHLWPNQKIDGHYYKKGVIPNDAELRLRLKEEQFHIARENGTEPAFQNLYWKNIRPGLYVDVISGEPLFSSADKFDNQNGRPNFTKPIAIGSIGESRDTSFGLERTEVHALKSKTHLGHLFRDGPGPDRLRYTVNSASLRFIPLEKLERAGYGDYLALFKKRGD